MRKNTAGKLQDEDLYVGLNLLFLLFNGSENKLLHKLQPITVLSTWGSAQIDQGNVLLKMDHCLTGQEFFCTRSSPPGFCSYCFGVGVCLFAMLELKHRQVLYSELHPQPCFSASCISFSCLTHYQDKRQQKLKKKIQCERIEHQNTSNASSK